MVSEVPLTTHPGLVISIVPRMALFDTGGFQVWLKGKKVRAQMWGNILPAVLELKGATGQGSFLF